ncbi:hypothetical protein EVAR_75677_1 [Eumeta japonica]|uniref:Uncharacterized protein n=1 Tax=Eumeta variegata TaxID=151549 RepID=A0A4C1W2V3_EUMVA|nr:hypothetical protein EVAR_75677_1 [Eumeta japonica]
MFMNTIKILKNILIKLRGGGAPAARGPRFDAIFFSSSGVKSKLSSPVNVNLTYKPLLEKNAPVVSCRSDTGETDIIDQAVRKTTNIRVHALNTQSDLVLVQLKLARNCARLEQNEKLKEISEIG